MQKVKLKLTYDLGLEFDGYYHGAREILFDESTDACKERGLELEEVSDKNLQEILIEYLSLPKELEIEIEDINLLDCEEYVFDRFIADRCNGFYPKYRIVQ